LSVENVSKSAGIGVHAVLLLRDWLS